MIYDRTRAQWGAVHDYTTDRTVEVPASQLFLHVTVTRPESYTTHDAHARKVEEIGISRFGIGISYNALIMPGGILYEGQPIDRRGAHTVNDKQVQTCPTHGGSLLSREPHPGTAGSQKLNLNYSARAIALARMDDDPVTDDDVEAAAKWGAWLISTGQAIPTAKWHGHRDVAWKTCPGNQGYSLIPQIESRMKELLVSDHSHTPAPEALPRSWADGTWEEWCLRSGTDRTSRTWDFYREDLGWVYSRVIAPLERQVAILEARVAELETRPGVLPEREVVTLLRS